MSAVLLLCEQLWDHGLNDRYLGLRCTAWDLLKTKPYRCYSAVSFQEASIIWSITRSERWELSFYQRRSWIFSSHGSSPSCFQQGGTTIWLVKYLRENSLTTTGSNFLDQSIKIYNEKKILVPEKACGTSKKALILRKLGWKANAQELTKHAVSLRRRLVNSSRPLDSLSERNIDETVGFRSRWSTTGDIRSIGTLTVDPSGCESRLRPNTHSCAWILQRYLAVWLTMFFSGTGVELVYSLLCVLLRAKEEAVKVKNSVATRPDVLQCGWQYWMTWAEDPCGHFCREF